MTETNSIDSACLESKEKHAINTIDNTETPTFNPKAFTTKRKHNHKTKPNYDYSIAKSMLKSIDSSVALEGLFDGDTVHLSFDCPTNLRLAFNAETKHNGTSVCKELTHFMAQYVFSSLVKKHALGNTISKLAETNFTIESMNFTQNVQNRPRRLVSCNSEVVGNDDVELDNRCMIGSCRNEAKEVMTYQLKGAEAKDFQVCVFHASAFAGNSVWRLKK